MASLSGGGTPRALPALQPGFERRCSRIKTPHQLLWETGNYYMHIVFLQRWHTLVHRPASPCIFFLQRGWEGRKPPDKNKFCSRSSAARVSPTRSPLFPIISFSLSHGLSAQQLFGLSGYLCFFSLLLLIFCICGKGHQLNVQIAFTYSRQHFISDRPPPPHTQLSLCYCLFCNYFGGLLL